MTPTSSGTFKGVNWRSLNFVEQCPNIIQERSVELNYVLEHGFKRPFHEVSDKAMYEFLHRPLTIRERRRLYLSQAKYRNNFRV